MPRWCASQRGGATGNSNDARYTDTRTDVIARLDRATQYSRGLSFREITLLTRRKSQDKDQSNSDCPSLSEQSSTPASIFSAASHGGSRFQYLRSIGNKPGDSHHDPW